MQSTHAYDDDLLSPSEAAVVLRVHRDTVRRWADNGLIAVQRTPTGHRRFRRADVEQLIECRPAGPSA